MVFVWAEVEVLSLSAIYIQGSQNILADSLSRKIPSSTNLCLHPKIFSQMVQRWGLPVVDLFASADNCLIQRFSSRQKADLALGVKPLSCPWPRGLLVAFPTFAVLLKFLLPESALK